MTLPSTLCVYCGSSPGTSDAYAHAARALGAALAAAQVGLVYGGGSVGLMGVLAQAVKDHGGRVTGVIPDFLIAKEGRAVALDETLIVPDMHTRKRLMFERADGFVALPGGIGTLEELVEMLTWMQLGRHRKPIVLVNVAGFWSPFLALIDHMVAAGFVRPAFRGRYHVCDRVEDVLPALAAGAAVPEPADAGDAVPLERL